MTRPAKAKVKKKKTSQPVDSSSITPQKASSVAHHTIFTLFPNLLDEVRLLVWDVVCGWQRNIDTDYKYCVYVTPLDLVSRLYSFSYQRL